MTVIRFSYALGFNSFSDMRKEMEKSVTNNRDSLNDNDNMFFLNKLSNLKIENFIQKESVKLRKAYQYIDYEEFKEICDILMNKKRILIIGFVDSFGTASELLHQLSSIRSRVFFSKLLYENTYSFDDMDEDSATLVVSYSPHYKFSKSQAETVKRNGSTIIAITDSLINPYREICDYSLVFNLTRNTDLRITDISPVLSFTYFMMNYLYEHYKEKIESYRNQYFISYKEDFFED